MSWESLPEEIHVQILEKLPYASVEACLQVNRKLRSVVERNKRQLARRKVDLVKISCEDEWEILVYSKEERKRKRYRKEDTPEKRGYALKDDDEISPLCDSLLKKLSILTKEANIKTLEIYEVHITPDFLTRLLVSLEGVTVDTVEISMSSFQTLQPLDFLRLSQINPTNVRLSWIRQLSDAFFCHEGLLDFLKARKTLELINLTNYGGKQVNIPLKIEELLDRGCWSFHLDQSSDVSEEQISKLVAKMTQKRGPKHVRIDCPSRPSINPSNHLILSFDKRGFSLRRKN